MPIIFQPIIAFVGMFLFIWFIASACAKDHEQEIAGRYFAVFMALLFALVVFLDQIALVWD